MQSSNISQITPTFTEEHDYLSGHKIRELQEVIYQSASYPAIFYARRSMRALLDERTTVCMHLNLSSRRKDSAKNIFQQQDKNRVTEQLLRVFDQCPDSLNSYNISIVEDLMSLYCFFSRDDQYVPLCKVCNTSIYVIVRLRSRANETDIGKMICSNAKCKKKLLQEFSVDLGDNDSLSRIKSKVKNQSAAIRMKRSPTEASKTSQSQNEPCPATEHDIQLIKRTVRKLQY